MRTISLHGDLGKRFGRLWKLDVRTPGEAVRAIEANKPGFVKHLTDSAEMGIGVKLLFNNRELEVEEFSGPFGEKSWLRIVPVYSGASNDWIKVVVGGLITAAAFAFSGGALAATVPFFGFSYETVALFGIALAVGGIANMLSKPPKDLPSSDPEDHSSYLFNGPVNVIAEGGPVPVGYGRLTVGSYVISGGIRVNEIPV